ncbi:hypothetical protein BDR05DRAFT_957002 [Suillus weaverae]|nr:hypothetical protein BDR05DRAFT_957002 [Suillus weaverae]
MLAARAYLRTSNSESVSSSMAFLAFCGGGIDMIWTDPTSTRHDAEGSTEMKKLRICSETRLGRPIVQPVLKL